VGIFTRKVGQIAGTGHGVISLAGKVTAGLLESNGSLPPRL